MNLGIAITRLYTPRRGGNKPLTDGMDMEEEERVQKRVMNSSTTCNMISIEELLEDYFDNLGIQVEPVSGHLRWRSLSRLWSSRK